ncbi:MAG: glycosyltransferase [Planctomycetota bacterium]|jgi:glycosyltransferase involved in cell wall biosynthesis
MERGESAGSFFDRTAVAYTTARYGRRARPFHKAFFGTRLRFAAEAIEGLPEGSRVVDVGCGPAPLSRALRNRGIEVVGVDFAPGMLRVARNAGASPIQGDASALPLRDDCADAVLLLGVTTYVADPSAMIREAARVLRPGGLLVVTATNRNAPDTRMRDLARRLFGGRGGSEQSLLAGVEVHTHSPAEFQRVLTGAGFSSVTRRGHNYTVLPFGRLLEGPSLALSRAAEAAHLPSGLASDTVFVARLPGPAPRRSPPKRRGVPVVRAIARLNVGGPAMHVALLNQGMDTRGYRSTLLAGRCEPGEADMADFARDRGVEPVDVKALGRSVSPMDDLRSFGRFLSVLRRTRPRVLHTHTAKAGALGRVAGWLAGVPVRIHTFHGHVFHGYFGEFGSKMVVRVERLLARLSHRILAVSDEVRDDIVKTYDVAPAGKVDVVPLGLDLAPFARAAEGEGRGTLRKELGLRDDDLLVGLVGRMVPIKDHKYFLHAGAELCRMRPDVHLVLVGSGPLEEDLRKRWKRIGIEGRCHFLGWRRDTATIAADLDLVALTSLNEGTPVALIEASAAGLPVVSRDVGGVASALRGVEHATLVPQDAEPPEFSNQVSRALNTARKRERKPDREVLERFSVERLCDDVDRIYREELAKA